MFIFSVSYPPVRAFSDSGRRLRPRTEQRSCRSAIPAKLSARWQKNAVQRHGARHFVTRLKSGFRGARRTRGCSQSGDLRFLPLFGQRLTAVSARRVFCPFGPQKTANRGLRPRKLMYFLTAKSTKNSPADASAYFVPSNVRNGRLFAGLQANRPRFLPLLAGPSFHGSGIGPGSFAAKGGAGVRRLFYGCLHRTGSQYPAVAPESGFKPLYAFCRAGFSSRDIGKLSTFHF